MRIWLTLREKWNSLKTEYLTVFQFPKKRRNQALFVIGYLLYAFPFQHPLSIQLGSYTLNVWALPSSVGIPIVFYSIWTETLMKK